MKKPLSIHEYKTLPKKLTGKLRTERIGTKRLMTAKEFKASGFAKESMLQEQCINWFGYKFPGILIRGSMNGAKLVGGARAWAKALRSGAINGEADLTIFYRAGEFHTLFVELKTQKGRQRFSQVQFEKDVVDKGHAYIIARSLDEFKAVVKSYIQKGIV